MMAEKTPGLVDARLRGDFGEADRANLVALQKNCNITAPASERAHDPDETPGRLGMAYRLTQACRIMKSDPTGAIELLKQADGCRKTIPGSWYDVLGIPEMVEGHD